MINDLLKIEIENAVNVLKDGGVILYPTDTIWGIGCDATNSTAVEKIYHIKRRDKNKSMIVMLESSDQLIKYVKNIPLITYQLLLNEKRPFTIIYPEAKNLAKNVIAKDGSIAIRIPYNALCIQLIAAFGKPIVSTSANFSGETSAMSFENISDKLLTQMDYIVKFKQDHSINANPSRIIKLYDDGSYIVIRE